MTLSLKDQGDILVQKEITVKYDQAEKLLPEIEKMLKKAKIQKGDLEAIEVVNAGGSFTSLRIGVVTANALGYALGIPVIGTSGEKKKSKGFSVVQAVYSSEPNITVKKED